LSATEAAWRRTSPLAAVFWLGRIYQAIAKNAWQSLAPLAAFVVAFRGDRLTAAIAGVTILVGATLVHAFLRWWFFRYRVTPDSILIRDGVFRKRQLDIRFERVQGINTTQNLVFRLFRLVTVNVDTAGAKGEEGQLPAVRHTVAEALRERIRRTPRPATPEGVEAVPAGAPSERLLSLSLGEVVRIGLSSGRVFLALVVIGPVLERLDDKLGELAEEQALLQLFGGTLPSFGMALALGAGVVLAIVVLLMAASVAGAILRWHGYELDAEDDVLRARSGLLTRHEQSVQRVKVQSLHVIQNFMLLRFRRCRLRLHQAAGGPARGSSRFVVPICGGETPPQIAALLFREELGDLPLDPRSPRFAPVASYYVRSRTVMFGVGPAVLAAVVLAPGAGAFSLLALLWIPVVAGGAWLRWRRFGVVVTRDAMAFRRGFLGVRIVAWLHRKVQAVVVVQSPFQRRRGLATLHFQLAGSAVVVPFVEYAEAARLRDYVLYRVERSERAWH
jgi:putative membrane protein